MLEGFDAKYSIKGILLERKELSSPDNLLHWNLHLPAQLPELLVQKGIESPYLNVFIVGDAQRNAAVARPDIQTPHWPARDPAEKVFADIPPFFEPSGCKREPMLKVGGLSRDPLADVAFHLPAYRGRNLIPVTPNRLFLSWQLQQILRAENSAVQCRNCSDRRNGTPISTPTMARATPRPT